jgi:hypothetical protein
MFGAHREWGDPSGEREENISEGDRGRARSLLAWPTNHPRIDFVSPRIAAAIVSTDKAVPLHAIAVNGDSHAGRKTAYRTSARIPTIDRNSRTGAA